VRLAPGIPGRAYPVAAGVPGPKDDGTVFHVPNSTVGMTLTQARNASDAPDWHPDEHPPMPTWCGKGGQRKASAPAATVTTGTV
jgi:hypothetical protein